MPQYFGPSTGWRFAERHVGTNCLTVGGDVRTYQPQVLEGMLEGASDNIWDVY